MLFIYLFITKKNLFLQVYEQRDKFRYVIKKGAQGKNKVIRDLSSCVIKKFDSYDILKAEIKGEEKKNHILIDIVYIPVNRSNETINCYFTNNLHLAYRSYYLRENKKTGEKNIEKLSARQCYYCDKYFSNISKFNGHVKCCSDIAGFIYKIEHKNVVIFQDNFS